MREGGNVAVAVPPDRQAGCQPQRALLRSSMPTTSTRTSLPGARAPSPMAARSPTSTMQGDTAVAGRSLAEQRHAGLRHGVRRDRPLRFERTRAPSISTRTSPDRRLDRCTSTSGYTEAEGNTDAQPFVEFGAPAAFDYDLRGRTPPVTFLNVDPTDPADAAVHLQLAAPDPEQRRRDLRLCGLPSASSTSGLLEVGEVRRQVHRSRPRAHLQRHDLRRLPRADQHDARHPAFAGGPTPGDFLHEHRRRRHAARATGRSTRRRSRTFCSRTSQRPAACSIRSRTSP